MSKIAFITDQHFGARSDSLIFSDYFDKFYANEFFPYLEKHNIKHIVGFGDTFDRRKYINFDTLRRCKQFWFDRVAARSITLDLIIGNHDVYFKNTNEVNAPGLLLQEYDNINIHVGPAEVEIDGTKLAFLPWVCSGNMAESMEFLENTDAQILLGHLEIQGFEMYRGSYNDHGFNSSLFSKFELVCSGHFHHKSTRDNINYLGSPYEITWADYNDPRGFHVFDTDTRQLTFVVNPYKMFNKIYYNDANREMEDVLDFDPEIYRGSFVKVVVGQKTNPYWFDLFIDKLEKSGTADLQVVEDHLNLNLEDDSEIVEEAEDTLTILHKVIDQLETNVPKKELANFLNSLYNEAQSFE